MSIDKSKLPPQLQELLTKLEESGVKFEVGSLEDLLKSGPTSSTASADEKDDCQCPACAARRAMGIPKNRASAAIAKALGIPPRVQAELDHQAGLLAKKLTDSVQALVEPLKLELQRQVEINDANMAKIADLQTQINDLNERHRKQVGLLHKRVTKRKGEVQDVKVRVATTRGRVTRVEKKLT